MLPVNVVYSLVLVSLYRKVASGSRIDDMQVVQVEKAPFAAVVLCNNNKYFCSGTILNADYVMTSAHCLFTLEGELTEDDRSVLVVAGIDKLDDAEEEINSGKAQIRQSRALVIHENYDFISNFIFDVVLIHLETSFEMTARVNRPPFREEQAYIKVSSKLKPKGKLSPDNTCPVFGYGKVYRNEYNVLDNSLKTQMLNVSKNCECLNYVWKLSWHHSVRTVIFICEADSMQYATLSGLCAGDQGAPLMCDGVLVGIGTTAFNYVDRDDCRLRHHGANECGCEQTMYVFTDLCPISHWIAFYVRDYPITDELCESYY